MSWRLAHALEQLRAEVLERWPDTTVWTIGDADHRQRASDHNPTTTGVVCAIDVVDDGRGQADELWTFLLERRDRRMKYAIHDARIVSATVSPWTVRTFDGHPHAGHIHVSVGRGVDGRSRRPELYDDPTPWGLADTPAPTPTPPTSWRQEVPDAMETIDLSDVTTDSSSWPRGDEVARVQSLLAADGAPPADTFDDEGVPDGIGGPATRAALEAFQLANPETGTAGEPDAIAGPATWGRLLGVS